MSKQTCNLKEKKVYKGTSLTIKRQKEKILSIRTFLYHDCGGS